MTIKNILLLFTTIVIIYSLVLVFIYKIYLTDRENNYMFNVFVFIILKIMLLIIYIYYVVNNKKIKEVEQILWILTFIYVGSIMMLVYWFIYINNNNGKDGHCT
jgi:cell division protein FtsW (lipid II flippase)